MRAQKGTGTVIRQRGKYRARWRIEGQTVYGDLRDTWELADLDRAKGKLTKAPAVKKSELPLFKHWAVDNMKGRYGNSMADTTHDANESYRMNYIQNAPIGQLRIDRITPQIAQDFADGIQKAPATVRRIVAFCSKLCSIAVKSELIRSNPFKALDLPKVQPRSNRILDSDELQKFTKPTDLIGVYIFAAALTGMRQSEMLRLQHTHIKKLVINVPGKKNDGSFRTIPLAPEVAEAFKLLPKRSSFVFANEDGKPYNRSYISREVKARLPEGMRLQDLRGTLISLMFNSGADLPTVMAIAGHSKAQTTLKAYARTVNKSEVKAIDMVRASIGLRDEKTDQTEGEENDRVTI